jgi:hypothetical protein
MRILSNQLKSQYRSFLEQRGKEQRAVIIVIYQQAEIVISVFGQEM